MPTPPPQKVVTRFAPSPTGELHIGGARTALFAWAYARKHHGQFLLRFEDTDQKRSSKQAEQNILRDLDWLELKSDNWGDHGDAPGSGIPRQSERLDLYNVALDKLAAGGHTYEDDGAVRFRMDKPVAFDDAVYGHIAVEADDLEDFVIRKADGFPTFHLAVVVDDADMNVTHVIRGQEHLSNTTKHAALYDALGLTRPVWCHTPSIMNPDGSKMSKRDKAKVARQFLSETDDVLRKHITEDLPRLCWQRAGMYNAYHKTISKIDDSRGMLSSDRDYWAQIAEGFIGKENDNGIPAKCIEFAVDKKLPEIDVVDFRSSGYTPDVLLNYLALLGWNPGNDLERFDRNFLTLHFGFERIGKSNSKFDREKLAAFSQDTILHLEPDVWAQKLHAHFAEYHPRFTQTLGDHFPLFAGMYQERSKTLDDPATLGAFFFDAPTEYQPKAVKKNLTKNDGEGLANLAKVREALAGLSPDQWLAETIHGTLDALWQQLELKNMGGVAQPLRVALTGNAVSPEIGPTLVVLGQEETRSRIDKCLASIS